MPGDNELGIKKWELVECIPHPERGIRLSLWNSKFKHKHGKRAIACLIRNNEHFPCV